jgi:antitoxin (DNA-binding transcriptional repressor) of toxin-antitoxin stability system
MEHATLSELRKHAKQYFDLIESGETVRVVRNGKPIADIVPLPQNLPSWKRMMPQPLVIDEGCSLSKIILEECEAIK